MYQEKGEFSVTICVSLHRLSTSRSLYSKRPCPIWFLGPSNDHVLPAMVTLPRRPKYLENLTDEKTTQWIISWIHLPHRVDAIVMNPGLFLIHPWNTWKNGWLENYIPRHPIIFSADEQGMSNHLLRNEWYLGAMQPFSVSVSQDP